MRAAGLNRAQPVVGNDFRALMVKDIELYKNVVKANNIQLLD